MAMAPLPCVVLASCDAAFVEEELVKQIIGVDELSESTTKTEVRSYPWKIDNKYYTADINLYIVPNTSLLTAEIAESVQAFVVYFDSSTKFGLDSVSTWLPLTEEWTPEVLILVCDRVSENGVNRQKAQEWCIKHGFELVELNPEELPDEDDDFPESTGVKRIVQALNANVWSNVEMKDDRNQGFGLLSSLTGIHHRNETEDSQEANSHTASEGRAQIHSEDTSRRNAALNSESDPQIDSIVDPMLDMDIQELASLTTGEADVENFERLFSKLKEMKDKAATMPHEQRKLHAEKVAKAFWMAIGGDRDEIEGLSSDEEN
ncbi:alpha- and gamma-adaptin-binding protein p34 [Latimeria chalumnae]|uniref:Alpha and gamma adaptin binding protein n=1 Tax=Latimeria chalumnae TaxID=7897 RepID=H3ASD2_LATCH|nr:PREDICTED: alpha- and gamma-adaptin-binding protein p34 [Latimeria chalumnae]|eukprot:XP_006001845.1 PREDICTED: alpha- and gamma-adaptin-binding protein p34 [Latimeria chalumnae]